MGNAANFTVIRDAWNQDLYEGVDFSVSSALDTNRRAVLTFMLKNFSQGDVSVTIRINGHSVWNWSFSGPKTRMYQEVIATDVLRAGGDNRINVETSLNSDGSFDFEGMEFSDVVLWYRVNI